MKPTMRFLLLLLGIILCFNSSYAQVKSLHDFTTTTIDGKPFPLQQLKGKKVLVVNTASECGLTPQYEVLQQVFEEYGGDDFVIIGFPANNFGGQEPGSNDEIKTFCSKNYGVTFPMMQKISVKGEDIDPIYEWLTTKELNGVKDAKVKWNFQKFMIDENGKWVDVVGPQKKPDCDKIIDWIKNG